MAARLKEYRPPKRTIHSAAESGDIESISYHLLEGVDVNGRTARGYFPLAGAAYNGHAQAVRYLLDHGAKIDMLTKFRWTALYNAVWREHIDVAEVLLDAKASTKVCTIAGEHGPSQTGFTVLHAAAHTGNLAMVKLLLKYGSDPGKKAAQQLPEDVARAMGHKEVAKLLELTRRSRQARKRSADPSDRNSVPVKVPSRFRRSGAH